MGVDRSRLPEVGADPSFSFPAIARHTLANGLEVRTVEHHSMPVLTLALIVEGGSGADPTGREGLAAIVADMVDEGTSGLSAIDVSDAIARIGGSYDVEVGPDATLFSLVTLTRFARRGASLLCDMVTKPSLLDGDFDRVRKLRLDRLRQIKDSPPAVAERAFLELLYAQHPYGHLSIGHEGSLTKLSRQDVVTFHRSAFRPSSATMIVVGAMNHEELLQTVAETFGGWEDQEPRGRSDSHQIAAEIEPDEPFRGIAIVTRDGAAQSELRMGHLSARRDTPDYPALLVMNAVLGGQFVSRINLKLREEKGYTVRRSHGLRLAARIGSVLAPGKCSHRGYGRRSPRFAQRARGDSGLAASFGGRTVAGEGIAHTGLSEGFRNRAAGGSFRRAAGALWACRHVLCRICRESERRQRR